MPSHASILDCERLGLPASPPLARNFTRRAFLAAGAACLFAPDGAAPHHALPQVDRDFWRRPRELFLKRLETGEQARVVYWAHGEYIPDAYAHLCWLLRDVQADKAVQMDTTLLNVMTGLQAYYLVYGVNGPLIVTSGYRTLETNQKLAGEGSARNSMHLYGRAADITLPGVPVEHLGQVKRYLHAGGLGFYPGKNFIHLDTGRPRTWRG